MDRAISAKRERAPTERQFEILILQFAKKHPKTVVERIKGKKGFYVTSFERMNDYVETPPEFHAPGWAFWWAFRLLHPTRLCRFEEDLNALFQRFKAGEGQWITYNEEKRILLARYLREPYQKRKR